MANHQPYERYQRQILLKELGEDGQQKLLNAKVLVIGAGGLGCPVLQYLAAAGVGTIGIIDDDTIAIHNLHRQPIYSMQDIGLPKASTAKAFLENLNPSIHITAYVQRLTVTNALPLLKEYDVIVDGSDNFATRYLVNDACVLLDKPFVYGAISQFEGQVAVFNHSTGNTLPANYRHLFPEPPKEGTVLNCEEAGVLGVLPGIIGTMQANETIKLITGIGTLLVNSLWTFNALTNQSYQFSIATNATTSLLIPTDTAAFEKMDYEWLCGNSTTALEISVAEFDSLRKAVAIEIIDVRAMDETPVIVEFLNKQIPLSEIDTRATEIEKDIVVVFCQSGVRSKKAVAVLAGIFGESKKIYSLKGGITGWKSQTIKPV
ncbi:MAG: hypothetical protein EAZ16_00650 [Sphingobacteriales bacterium]|nr:MAG: hypothetical protein EAZ16_00650 [Sphingobacteriales bacterium]